MPDYVDNDDITPRKPTKADYRIARQFKCALCLPCRLWVAGHRRTLEPHEWQAFLR